MQGGVLLLCEKAMPEGAGRDGMKMRWISMIKAWTDEAWEDFE